MIEAVADALAAQAAAVRARLEALIRLPSVSTDPAGEPGTRAGLPGWFREGGVDDARQMCGGGHTALHGSGSGSPR